MSKLNKIRRNYYRIELPLDLADEQSLIMGDLHQMAMAQADSQTRKCFLPQTWTSKLIGQNASNYIFRVIRYHR